MTVRHEAWLRWTARGIAGALFAVAATGCVETSLYEKAALDLDGARRENALKDQQIRALQWQLGAAGQQIQAITQQDATALGDLDRRVQEASAANRALAERLKARDLEAEKLTAALARAEEEASARKGPPGPTVRLRPEDLKQIQAAAGARDADVSKLLLRVEKLFGDRATAATRPGERPPRVLDGDLIDPWEGGRK